MTKPSISPSEALAKLFTVIREQAAANPKFASEMLSAMGVQVVFQGPEAALSIDPVVEAGRLDHVAFRERFSTFSESDLKKMITNFGLGTADDIRKVTTRPKKIGFIELLWSGARSKLH